MATTRKINLLIADIEDGVFDMQLEVLLDAITQRKCALGRSKYHQFSIGDKVRIVGNLRPTYVINREAIVISKRNKKLVVDLLHKVPGQRFSTGMVIDPACLELV